MNKSTLEKEGNEWVKEEIITEEQLSIILSRYKNTSTNNIFITFAVLFISIGILLFVFSDWTFVSPIIRTTLLLFVMITLYSYGFSFYKRKKQGYGIGFIILGYIFFGATLFFLNHTYQVPLFLIYSLPIWSMIGLCFIFRYRDSALLIVGMLVTVIGQGIITTSLEQFSWLLFFIFLIGYFYFVYNRPSKWSNILFSAGLIVQTLYLTYSFDLTYYWLLTMYFLLYVLALYIPKQALHRTIIYVSITASFFVRSFETVILEDPPIEYINMKTFFWSFWIIVAAFFIITIVWKKKHEQWINLLIFIPFVFTENPTFIIIICLFIVSIYWVIHVYRHVRTKQIPLSMTIFLISTFTAYIQFGWDSMNRSLFFIIGGIILFGISFFFEHQRRKLEMEEHV